MPIVVCGSNLVLAQQVNATVLVNCNGVNIEDSLNLDWAGSSWMGTKTLSCGDTVTLEVFCAISGFLINSTVSCSPVSGCCVSNLAPFSVNYNPLTLEWVVASGFHVSSGCQCCPAEYPGAYQVTVTVAASPLPPALLYPFCPMCPGYPPGGVLCGGDASACAPIMASLASNASARYGSGEVIFSATDTLSTGSGGSFNHTRSFANRLTQNFNVGNGYNWMVAEWPHLVIQPTSVFVMGAAQQMLCFDLVGTSYVGRFGIPQTLVADPANAGLVLMQADGTKFEFDDLSGILRQVTDVGGATWVVTSLSPNGYSFLTVQREFVVGSNTTIEQLVYEYSAAPGDDLLTQITVRTQLNGGAWTNVRQVVYTYYGSGDSFGDVSDLQLVTTQVWQGSGWVNTGTSYYRYWKTENPSSSSSSSSHSSSSTSSHSSGSSSSSGGATTPLHLLKFALNAAAYNRMVADGYNPMTALDSQLSLYADYYFECDSQRRVTLETVKSGSQTYMFAYAQSSFTNDYNQWQTKTTETLPDGNLNIVYSNYAGLTMLKVFQSGTDQWIDFWRYDANGKVILHANPSAVTGFDDSHADLMNYNSGTGLYQYLRNSAGLIKTFTIHAPSGNLASVRLQEGQTGTSILLRSMIYTQCGGTGSSSSSSSSARSSSSSSHASSSSLSSSSSSGSPPPSSGIWYLSQKTVYPSDTDPTQTIVTSFAYSFYSGTCAVQQRVTTLPVISTAQNGSGVAATRSDYFDIYGNPTWQMDERGFITQAVYDIPTGAVSQWVQDVNTSMYPSSPAGWSTPSGGGLNLVTDFLFDSFGRTTQTLAPTNTIDLSGTATTLRSASWTYFDDANFVTYSGQGYATGSSPSYLFELINPVSITQMDASDRVNAQIQAASTTTSGSLPAIITAAGSGAAAFPQSTYVRWTTMQYTDCCLAASQCVYKLIPSSGTGSSGTNFDETIYGYDVMKRQNRTVTPGGTITDLVFDARSNLIATYIGTDDTGATPTDPTGGGAPGNNMVLVTTNVFDGAAAGGNGNKTAIVEQIDATTMRTTLMIYDFRDRLIAIDGEVDYYAVTYYDNLDRITAMERYNTTGPYSPSSSSSSSSSSGSTIGNLILRSLTNWDDRRRVYQSIKYGVDQTTGLLGNSLADNFWFDACGNSIKSLLSGSQMFVKKAYDSLNRVTIEYRGYGPDATYADAQSVTNNCIFEQNETTYDVDSNVIQSTNRQRYHNAPATQAGPLQNPSMTPNARVTYMALYPDAIGRTVTIANYGTNGGANLIRPTTAPTRATLILVDTTSFNSAGDVFQQTDPAGQITQSLYDAVGRKTTVTANDNTSVSSSSSSSSSYASSSSSLLPGCVASDDINAVTQYTYTPDGNLAALIVINSVTGNQTTTWTYGTTLINSAIASSQLLLSVSYPDSIGGSDLVSYSYNRQGQKISMTDQRGCVHSYLYDLLGRAIHDSVTTLGTGVDGDVRRLSITYEVRGMVASLTSWDNSSTTAGTIVNESLLTYNTFAQRIADYQSHSGGVNIASSLKTAFGYADGSSNSIRPTTLTYPNGRVLTYNYGTAGGINDCLGRIASLIDNDGITHLADYSYVGLSSAVVVNYSESGVEYSLASLTGTTDPTTGDIYSGFDSFDRVTDCRWYSVSSSTDVARLKYAYDEAGNRLWREDTVAAASGQLYDEFYVYDGLNRLKNMQRGAINTMRTGITSPIFEQCWSLDATSNWFGFRESDNGNAWALVQERSANEVNEVTGITNLTGSTWAIPAYDSAGNVAILPQPSNPSSSFACTYDAWNRLVTLVDTSSGYTVQQNQYDARTFRTIRTSYAAGSPSETRHFYYATAWQIVEERVGSGATAYCQNIWGLRYIDDFIVRDRDSTGGGTLNERLYALQDAFWNTVALIDVNGTPQERYAYSAFGTPLFLTPTFAPSSGSNYDSEILFCGYRWDPPTGLYHVRNRVYTSLLGVWLQRDFMEYVNGASLYCAYFVPSGIDPSGNSIWLFTRPYPTLLPKTVPTTPTRPTIIDEPLPSTFTRPAGPSPWFTNPSPPWPFTTPQPSPTTPPSPVSPPPAIGPDPSPAPTPLGRPALPNSPALRRLEADRLTRRCPCGASYTCHHLIPQQLFKPHMHLGLPGTYMNDCSNLCCIPSDSHALTLGRAGGWYNQFVSQVILNACPRPVTEGCLGSINLTLKSIFMCCDKCNCKTSRYCAPCCRATSLPDWYA